MKYGFNVYKTKVEGHVFWVAESEDLKGCVGQGESIAEALGELASNEEEWLDAAKEYGLDIPEPTIKTETETEYSGKFMTRVSTKVHKEAVEHAIKEGISLNQYVNNAIITMNAANSTVKAIKPIISEVKSMMFADTVSMWKNGNESQTLSYNGMNEYPVSIYSYPNIHTEA